MHYTITTMNDFDGTQTLSLDKCGSQYMVGHYDKLTSTYTHKRFDTIEEAEAIFLKIAQCFIRCTHTAEARAEMLKNA